MTEQPTQPKFSIMDKSMTQRLYAIFVAFLILTLVSYIFRANWFVHYVFYASYFFTGIMLGVVITIKAIIYVVQRGVERDLMPVMQETMRKFFPEMAGPKEVEEPSSEAAETKEEPPNES